MLFLELLPFLTSSLLVFWLIYTQAPISFLQQISSVLLAILLIFIIKFIKLPAQTQTQPKFRLILTFLSSLFIQLLVVSTGGFLSPLLILLHLYTLAISFLMNFKSSIVFLLLSVLILIINTQVNLQMRMFFKDDPFTFLLYFVSFIVIIPLAQLVTKTYQLKDVLAKKLREYLQITESREESILKGLNELVVVTDVNLTILFANPQFEKIYKKDVADIANKPLLDVVILEDEKRNKITKEQLSIGSILADQTSRIINGYRLSLKDLDRPLPISIQVRPVINISGKIDQLVFIITNSKTTDTENLHLNFEKTRIKNKQLIQKMHQGFASKDSTDLSLTFDLLVKGVDDLTIAYELVDHPIQGKLVYQDVALICKKLIEDKNQLAGELHVSLKYNLDPNETAEIAYQNIYQSSPSLTSQLVSKFAAQVNLKWFEIMIDKLLHLVMLYSSRHSSQIEIIPQLFDENTIEIIFETYSPSLADAQIKDFFVEYYSGLGETTNLILGSGLEGYIVRKITNQLHYQLNVEYNKYNSKLFFKLKIPKQTFDQNLS